MYCLHCGKEIPGETIPNFCPNCGAQLRPLDAEPVANWMSDGNPASAPEKKKVTPEAETAEDDANLSLPELVVKYTDSTPTQTKPTKPTKSFWQSLLEVQEKPHIVRTFIVTEDSRRSASSTALRGAVGGMLGIVSPGLGLVGAAAGVMSGKNKHTTTFVIEYSYGHRVTETVKNNSKEYKLYCTYLNL